jgi:enoyl-[acyl-carrier-protein] reductase (NADH)
MAIMQGKRGLIMGLANDKSLAWGIAKAWPSRARNWRSAIRAR